VPLLAMAPQNLWGRASNDITTLLAQRALAKQQAMLNNLKLGMAVRASNDTSDVQQSTAAKNAAESAAQTASAGKTTQETTDLQSKAKEDDLRRQHLQQALDGFKAATDPETKKNYALDIMNAGGKLPTEGEMQGVAMNPAQIGALLDQLEAETDPQKRKNIEARILNAGGKVPTEAAPRYIGTEGGVLDTRTGAFTPNPNYVPPGAHKDDPELPDELKAYLNTLPASTNPATGKPYTLEDAIAKVQHGISGAGGGPGGLSLMQKYPKLDLAKVGTYLRQAYGNPMQAGFTQGAPPETPGAQAPVAAPAPSPTPTGAAAAPPPAQAPLKIGVIKLPSGPYEVNLNPDGTYNGAHGDVWKLEGGQWTRIK
jgi:hypothetical protein